MSMRTFLARAEVRSRFNEIIVLTEKPPRLQAVVPCSVPPGRVGVIGIAFDYLFCFTVLNINKSPLQKGRSIAEYAARNWEWFVMRASRFGGSSFSDNLRDGPQYRKTLSSAINCIAVYVENGIVTEALLRSCIFLASLNLIRRTGGYYRKKDGNVSSYFENLCDANEAEIEELRALHEAIPTNVFANVEVIIPNPTFSIASTLVGGADADLILDDTLLEIKTTSKIRFPEHIRQLVGYYCLDQLLRREPRIGDSIPAKQRPEVKNLAIYYARQKCFCKYPVEKVIDMQRFPAFLEWFRAKAEEIFKTSWDEEILRLSNPHSRQ